MGCGGAVLFVRVADGAEMEEGMKVEALVRGSVAEPGAATVSRSGSLEWSRDCRACRVAGGPGRAGVVAAAAAEWLIGGSCCGSGGGPGMLPSAAAAAAAADSPCPCSGATPCGFPHSGPSAEPGPRRGGPGAGPTAAALGGLSGARCWEGSAEERGLAGPPLLFRSADRKVGSLDELWFWRWVCGHAGEVKVEVEVEHGKDDEGGKVGAEELSCFLDPPSSMEVRRACWEWWPCPRATPLD